MKKVLLFLFLICSVSLGAQNNDYLLRMDGVGLLKLERSLADVEKVYENYLLSVGPDYEGEDYHLSKTLSSIYVYSEDSDNSLVFHLKNKKVFSIEIMRLLW